MEFLSEKNTKSASKGWRLKGNLIAGLVSFSVMSAISNHALAANRGSAGGLDYKCDSACINNTSGPDVMGKQLAKTLTLSNPYNVPTSPAPSVTPPSGGGSGDPPQLATLAQLPPFAGNGEMLYQFYGFSWVRTAENETDCAPANYDILSGSYYGHNFNSDLISAKQPEDLFGYSGIIPYNNTSRSTRNAGGIYAKMFSLECSHSIAIDGFSPTQYIFEMTSLPDKRIFKVDPQYDFFAYVMTHYIGPWAPPSYPLYTFRCEKGKLPILEEQGVTKVADLAPTLGYRCWPKNALISQDRTPRWYNYLTDPSGSTLTITEQPTPENIKNIFNLFIPAIISPSRRDIYFYYFDDSSGFFAECNDGTSPIKKNSVQGDIRYSCQ